MGQVTLVKIKLKHPAFPTICFFPGSMKTALRGTLQQFSIELQQNVRDLQETVLF